MKRKILSIILALTLFVTLLPATVSAGGRDFAFEVRIRYILDTTGYLYADYISENYDMEHYYSLPDFRTYEDQLIEIYNSWYEPLETALKTAQDSILPKRQTMDWITVSEPLVLNLADGTTVALSTWDTLLSVFVSDIDYLYYGSMDKIPAITSVKSVPKLKGYDIVNFEYRNDTVIVKVKPAGGYPPIDYSGVKIPLTLKADLPANKGFPVEFVVEEWVKDNYVMMWYNGAGGDIVIPEGIKEVFSVNSQPPLNVTVESGNNTITSVTLPKSLVRLERAVFYGCTALKTVIIPPNTITEIPESAFYKSSLESIVIPQGVTTIGKQAFDECSKLTSITIPSSVTEISPYGFHKSNKVTIYCEAGSYAESYAKKYGIPYVIGSAPSAAVPTPAPAVAKPTSSTVLVNGKNIAFDAYNINGNNYFKLRDLAHALNGSKKQFEVGWDAEKNAISLTSGKPYTSVGGEMASKGSGSKTPKVTTSKIYLDGKEVALTAYNIEGNNYFKLRDIGEAFNFGVDWDGANNTIVIDTSKNYTPQ